MEAKQSGLVKRVMARRMKYDLIAPDEVGYVPLADAAISFRAIFRSFRDRLKQKLRPHSSPTRIALRYFGTHTK